MTVTPNSTIEFFPGVISVNTQYFFRSDYFQIARDNYFNNQSKLAISNYQYIRRTRQIRVSTKSISDNYTSKPEELLKRGCYFRFKNTDFADTYYYCVITGFEYINNDTYAISYAVDYFMTFWDNTNDRLVGDMPVVERESLTAGEKQSLTANKFTPIQKMISAEPSLNVSVELEKYDYEIDNSFKKDTVNMRYTETGGSDGIKFFQSVNGPGFLPSFYDETGYIDETVTLIKFSPFDLAKLDKLWADTHEEGETLADAPSTKWAMVFDYPHEGEYFYFSGPNKVTAFEEMSKAFKTALDNHGFISLYDNFHSNQMGCNFVIVENKYEIEAFLNFMATYNLTSCVISMTMIPRHLIGATFRNESTYRFNKPTNESYKINFFPFSYLRVFTGEGQIKEYKYERFKDNIDFRLIGSFEGQSQIALAPINYNWHFMKTNYPSGSRAVAPAPNMTEAITLDTFLQQPYSIDGYTVALGQTAANVIKNKTFINDYTVRSNAVIAETSAQASYLGGITAPIMAGVSLAAGGASNTAVATNAASAGLNIPNMMTNLQKATQNNEIAQMEKMVNDDAGLALLGDKTNRFTANMLPTRAAYAADQYVGDLSGSYLTYNRYMPNDFYIVHVSLTQEVKNNYANFFNYNGFAYGGIKYPAIMRRSRNDKPAWCDSGGNDSVYYYVKTKGYDVHGDMPKEAKSYINTLFDNGVLFEALD